MAEEAVKRSPAAEFVRGLSAEMTMREMDAAVKAAGFHLSHARVYQIRSQEKLGYKRAPGNQHRSKPKPKHTSKRKYTKRVTAREAIEAIAPKPQPPSVDAKEQLRRIAMRIGLIKLAELVHEIEREAGM
jgi:hypothetical protein